ncbi:MAG: TetR/AcrR family transcriptional regulator [Alphaproteobacteria bacterium]|nr:TetR/AcrR family transcriptional regulator [Alphaproteobacteria bacterium]MDE2109740.1 TetR/AcrR family transcriptional regulator [Alphaproteobacteria bacterium]MDE2494364.1 TetR/AcrR family transcriptional regulator [Alphaproteobacteria bacterium]
MSYTEQTAKPVKHWTRRKQARPGEILDAALTVFAEKGFAAARMEDIAARAGVTKGTIYLYFSSKEDVFKSLARVSVGATLTDAALQAGRFEGSAREFLTMFLSAVAEMIQHGERVILPKIIIAESGNFPELARFWRDEVIDKAMAMLSGVIAKGIASGEFRNLPADHVARLCIAPLILSIIWRTTFAPYDKTPFDYRKLFETHIDVLLKGLAPEGTAP